MSPSYAVAAVARAWPGLSQPQIEYRLRESTFVGIARRYMYFQVPKAGCTSMKTLIHAVERLPPVTPFVGAKREVRRDMFIHERSEFRLPSLLDFDDATQQEILGAADFFRFTVVRDPYTRLLSAWGDKVRLCAPGHEGLYHALKGALPTGRDPGSIISFGEFVRSLSADALATCNQHWRLQTAHLFCPAIDFSMIGRLERLGAVVDAFCAHAGVSPLAPPGMNEAAAAGGFDVSMAARIHALYRADFDAFGYPEDGWPRPPQGAGGPRTVPEARYIDEVIERNIVIGHLYAERDRLAARLLTARCRRVGQRLRRLAGRALHRPRQWLRPARPT